MQRSTMVVYLKTLKEIAVTGDILYNFRSVLTDWMDRLKGYNVYVII